MSGPVLCPNCKAVVADANAPPWRRAIAKGMIEDGRCRACRILTLQDRIERRQSPMTRELMREDPDDPRWPEWNRIAQADLERERRHLRELEDLIGGDS